MKRILLAVLAAAVFPLAAQADDLSYTFLQAGYSYAHNNSNSDSHGWSGTGSAAIGPNFDIFGDGSRTSRSLPNDDSSHVNGWGLGGGFHTPIAGNTDFVGDVSYHQSEITGVNGDVNYAGEIGVRSALAPQVEGWVYAGYSDAHNDTGNIDRSGNGKFFGKIGGQFKFNKNWGLVGEVQASSGLQQYFIGPRYSF